MTKPTSETVQTIKSELALYNEKLKGLERAHAEATEAMKALGCQADQTADVINSLQATLDRLEKYEEEYPEDDPDDLPITSLPLMIKDEDYS